MGFLRLISAITVSVVDMIGPTVASALAFAAMVTAIFMIAFAAGMGIGLVLRILV